MGGIAVQDRQAPTDVPRTPERRRFPRYSLRPMYTSVLVRPVRLGRTIRGPALAGHLYDIGEGGVCLELDRPLEPGPVLLEITIPAEASAGPYADVVPHGQAQSGLPMPPTAVRAYADVVWVDKSGDEPGPVRMGAAFTRFATRADREALRTRLAMFPA